MAEALMGMHLLASIAIVLILSGIDWLIGQALEREPPAGGP